MRTGQKCAGSAACWFTNLDFAKRHEDLILFRNYDPDDYPTYDNYDAIEVAKVVDIPMDYDGVMGVPITFLDKHNPDQFEIVGISVDVTRDAQGRRNAGERRVAGATLRSATTAQHRVTCHRWNGVLRVDGEPRSGFMSDCSSDGRSS